MYKIETATYYDNAFQKFGSALETSATVQDYYQTLSLDHLKDLCRIYGAKGYSKLKKADLIAFVSDMVFTETSYQELYLTTSSVEFKAVQELGRNGKVHIKAIDFELALRLINLGMVFMIQSEGQYYIVLPSDQKAKWSKYNLSPLHKQAKSMHNYLQVIQAALHLYGVVKVEDVAKLYKHYHKGFQSQHLAQVLQLSDRKLVAFGQEGDYLYAMSLHGQHVAYYEQAKPHEFYLPKGEIFAKYADVQYYEADSETVALKKYFQLNFGLHQNVAEDLTSDVVQYLYQDYPFSEIMSVLQAYPVRFHNDEHVRMVAGRINLFKQTMRQRKLRGNKGTI
ncbi:MAG: hypothetical protein ACRDBX_03800 [Erysipelotrichaceae bacterium]